jgi:DNA-binding NarL/FixJ family response regulator
VRRRRPFVTILVGKDSLLREGLAAILRSADFRILASVSCADDLAPCKIRSQQSLFLFVHTGNSFETVLTQIQYLRNEHPRARIVIVADRYRLAELVDAIRAGANGYFVDILTSVFIRSLELLTFTQRAPAFLSFVLGPEGTEVGEHVTPNDHNHEVSGTLAEDRRAPHLAGGPVGEQVRHNEKRLEIPITPAEDNPYPQLSERQKSILRCLVQGDSNKSIARKLEITQETVKVHVKAILRKIQVQNRTQAAVWGMNNESLTRPANASSSPELSNPLPETGDMISELKQIGASARLAAVEREQNGVAVPRTDALTRKGHHRNGLRPG